MTKTCKAGAFGTLVAGLVLPVAALAQQEARPDWPTFNMLNSPGLIETPSGRPSPDGEIGITVSTFAGISRYQFAAQVHPRVMGGFRYSEIQDFNAAGFETYYDRSFDLRFTLVQESKTLPAVTVGLQDFIGTGIYGAEYLVASKRITPQLELSAGLGWGRLAGDGPLPGFGARPELTPERVAEGGEPNLDSLFRGDIGYFGGIQWRVLDNLILKAEYSSDQYDLESGDLDIFERSSPFNFGLSWLPNPASQVSAYYMYGSEFGLQLSFSFNPDRPVAGGSLDPAPFPVTQRPSRSAAPEAYATGWSSSAETRSTIAANLEKFLLLERLEMEGLDLSATSATLYLRNTGYAAEAQAMGRAARLMTFQLPASVETFTIVPLRNGVPLPSFTFRRSDLERYEIAPDGTEQILAAAVIDSTPATPRRDQLQPGFYPRFNWNLSPYMRSSLFDPDNPFRADLGLRLAAGYELSRGLVVGGSLRKRVVGNLDQNDSVSDSVLPHVRSDFAEYDREGDPGLDTLTTAWYARPGEDLYSRLTVGYLETMFAGVSSELLWAPYETPFAVGAELNYVRQRDFEGGFGLQDYDVLTGHASLYYRVTPDFLAQLDVGRYLAGDEGATFSLERVYANGWRVGAFATFTNVTADEFGEGSFDKGFKLSIPLGWFNGKSNARIPSVVIRPLQRDGGARLDVGGRLFGVVEPGRKTRVEEQWGRFWR